MAVIATDEFGRTDATGWGTADSGQTWTERQGTTSWTVDGSQGVCDMGTSGTRSITLGVSETNVDVKLQVSWDEAAAGGDLNQCELMARWADTTHFYDARFSQETSGEVFVRLVLVNGSSSFLSSAVSAGSVAVLGEPWWVRFQVIGSVLRAKAWADGDVEPGWLVEATDSTLTAAGPIGIRNGRGAGSTAAPVVSYDHLYCVEPYGGIIDQQAFPAPILAAM